MPVMSHEKAQKAHNHGRWAFYVCALLWQLLASEHSHALKVKTSPLPGYTRPIILTQQFRGVQQQTWTTSLLKPELA